jgi:tetratricopeptide (TPR) repeat protein
MAQRLGTLPERQTAAGFHQRGLKHEKQGNLQAALADFDEALRLNPFERQYYECRGRVRVVLGDFNGAISDYNVMMQLVGKNKAVLARAYFYRGDARRLKTDHDGAIADYTEALRLRNETRRILHLDVVRSRTLAAIQNNRGVAYLNKHDDDNALADFTAVVQLARSVLFWRNTLYVGIHQPAHQPARRYHGSLDDPNDVQRAAPAARRALFVLQPLRPDAAGDHAQAADFEEAIRLEKSGKKENLVYVYVNRARSSSKRGDHTAALADCDEAIRLAADQPGVLPFMVQARGEVRSAMGDLGGAIAEYSEAIRLNPQVVDFYRARARAYTDKGDSASAEADLARAQQALIDPPAVEIDLNAMRSAKRGSSLRTLFATLLLVAALTVIILSLRNSRPQTAQSYYSTGNSLYNNGDYGRAIEAYTDAIKSNPAYAQAYYMRGRAYRQEQEYRLALDDLTEAIRLSPRLVDAYYYRALVLDRIRDTQGAIADFEKVLELDPKHRYAEQIRAYIAGHQIQ